MKPTHKERAPMVTIKAAFEAVDGRWACNTSVPIEVHEEIERLNKALRGLGPWKAGANYLIENGDVQIPIEWTGGGKAPPFDIAEFCDFVQKINSYVTASSLERLDPGSPKKRQRKEDLERAFEGKDGNAIAQLVATLSKARESTYLLVGKDKQAIKLMGGGLPDSVRNERFNTRVRVRERKDYLLLSLEGRGPVLVEKTDDTDLLKVGDRVVLHEVSPLIYRRCIQASEARLDQLDAGECEANSAAAFALDPGVDVA